VVDHRRYSKAYNLFSHYYVIGVLVAIKWALPNGIGNGSRNATRNGVKDRHNEKDNSFSLLQK